LWGTVASLSRLFWAVVVAISVVVGIAAGGLFFLPRVSVDISEPIEPSKPFSAPFVATNNNIVPLNSVNFYIGVCKLVLKATNRAGVEQSINVVGTPDRRIDDSVPMCATPNGSRYSDPAWLNHKLAPDEKFSRSLSEAYRSLLPPSFDPIAKVDEADITIVVSFKPWILPWRRESEFRFATDKLPDGKYRWFARSLDNR
jgi:hypothetical protein